MIIRATDIDGDWTFGTGKSNFLSDLDALAQDLETRIKEFINDCFFNTRAGVDWTNLIGSKNVDGLKIALRDVILGTQNVTGIRELTASIDDDRRVTIVYGVTTVFDGEVTPKGDANKFIQFFITESGDFLITESGGNLYA